MRYAGFWLRFVAWFVDTIILVIVWQVISLFFPAAPAAPPSGASPDVIWKYWLASLPPDKVVVSTIICWAYFALQESSSVQATLGKRLLGIRVSREDGGRLGLGAASVRAWPLYLNSAGWIFGGLLAGVVAILAFISCLAVAFSSRKQGLHDKMAGAILTRR